MGLSCDNYNRANPKMAEHSDQHKPDVCNDKYMSKRSLRKTLVDKRRYIPVQSAFSTEDTSGLPTAGKVPAGCTEGTTVLDPVSVNDCKDVSTIHQAGSEPEKVCRVKLEDEGADCGFALDPKECNADKDVKSTREHKPMGMPQFVFTAMKKRSMVVDTENRPYKCPYCKWTFKKSSNLLSHMETHSGLKPHVCELCGKAYAQQGTLQQHKRLHTGERPYSCPFCGKTYVWSSDYRKHIRTHTGEKPYVCAECGKEFVRSSDLRKHERNKHSNDKPFPCSSCGKTFNKPLSLQRHERTHLGERPFICPDCGKAFSLPSRLAEHRKVHSGVRPFTCPICSKAFTKSSNLNEHMSVHTGLRPHTCKECGIAFAMPSRLIRHQRSHTTRRLQHVLQSAV